MATFRERCSRWPRCPATVRVSDIVRAMSDMRMWVALIGWFRFASSKRTRRGAWSALNEFE
jgi:hypothetical protein